MAQIASIAFLSSPTFHIVHSPLIGVQSPMTILLFIYHSASVVAIATGSGLDGPRLEHLWGQDIFSSLLPSKPALGTNNEYRGFLPEMKRLVRGVDHQPRSDNEVKERGGLYLYSFSAPAWLVAGD